MDKKRFLAIFLSLIIVFSSVMITSAADRTLLNDGLPEEGYQASFGTALVDGSKDEAYDASAPIYVNKTLDGSTADDGRATATVYPLFDGGALYYFAEVIDSSVVLGITEGQVKKDTEGINFYIDFLFSEDSDYKSGNTNSWISGEQGRIEVNFVGNEQGTAEYTSYPYLMNDKGDFYIQMKSVQTAAGYNVELKVGLSDSLQAKLSGSDQPVIGVGFQVNDCDPDKNTYTETTGSEGRSYACWDYNEVAFEYAKGSQDFSPMTLRNDQIQIHTITVDSAITGGVVSADKASAVTGETIKLSVTPNSGMQLVNGSLKANNQEIKKRSFTMPNQDVVITAQFQEYTITDDENSIKVISQNVDNEAYSYDFDHNVYVTNSVRAERMAALFKPIHPDSIGFQEVVGDTRNWARLLVENFPEYDYIGFGRDFMGSNDTIREDYVNNVSSGEATPIFYLRDKYDLVESGTWWLSATPGINPGGIHYPEDKASTWGATYKMTCTWAVLKNKETGKLYAHVNTHLDPEIDHARTESMKIVVRKISDLAFTYGADLPIVITGDWNCNQYSDAYQVLTSNDYVKVADGAYCLPEDRLINWGVSLHDFGRYTAGYPIDIAFITPDNAQVTYYEILTSPVDAEDGSGSGCLSDHYGVYIAFDPDKTTERIREVPERELIITDLTAAYGTPTVDGTKDEIYNESHAAKICLDVNGAKVSDQIATGEVSTVYDDNYLYCFAEITDPTPSDKAEITEDGDCPTEGVIFMLDFLNDDESDELYPAQGEQGIASLAYAALTGTTAIGTVRQFTMPYTFEACKTDKGYNIELRVELSDQLKARINKGKEIVIGAGFQLSDDTNNDGKREIAVFSSEKLDFEWQDVQNANGGCRCFQNLSLISQIKSSDARVLSITANGVQAAAGSAYNYSLVFDYGQAPGSADDFVIMLSDAKASVSSRPSTSDNGKTWTFTVTAEDGTTANYTITITVGENPAEPDNKAPAGNKPTGGTAGTSTSTPKVTASDGMASVAVNAADMTSIIAGAKKKGSTAIVIAPEIIGKANKVSVELQKSSVSDLATETDAELRVETPVGNITIPNDVLASIASQASGGSVTMSLETVNASNLTAEQQAAVGNNPVYDISIISGSGLISSFGGGSITISLPYTLKEGEAADKVGVWYLNDEGELERMVCTYDAVTGKATFTTSHLSYYLVGVKIPEEDEFAINFTDVREGDWFYENVKYVVQKGLFTGTGVTTFSPDLSMTRAMLVTVLYRLEGFPAVTDTSVFTDVKDGRWYSDAVLWANANGIVDGYGSGVFGTSHNVTREQMAAILYRYARYKGYDVAAAATLEEYADARDISSWAKTAMQWVVAEGIITGRTTTTLAPDSSATRAEAAAVLQRFVDAFVTE